MKNMWAKISRESLSTIFIYRQGLSTQSNEAGICIFPSRSLLSGADLEIKKGGGFPSSRNSVSAGGLGGAVSPPVGLGQSLGGGPGGEAPGSSPDFEFFLP